MFIFIFVQIMSWVFHGSARSCTGYWYFKNIGDNQSSFEPWIRRKRPFSVANFEDGAVFLAIIFESVCCFQCKAVVVILFENLRIREF